MKSYRGESDADRLVFEGDIIRADVVEECAYYQIVNYGSAFRCLLIWSDTGETYGCCIDNPDLLEDIAGLDDGLEIIGSIHDWAEGS